MAKQSFVTGQVLTAQQVNDLQTNDFNQTVSAKTASYTLVAADKGTRITMSSTSATTITVNTGLFAAGDTLFIQNLNTGVSTITAGTATVSTSASLALAQHEGGTLYFTSAGVSTFFKAAGAAAASGGMTLINSGGTAMTGTTVSFTSIPTTYKMLQLHIINTGSSGNINTIMRFNGDTGSNYSFNSQQNSGTANQAAFSNGTVTSIQSLGFTNTANNKNSYFIQLPEYTLTSGEQPVYARSNSTDTSFVTSGSYTKSAAITQIDIISDGNSWDNGTAFLYGVS